jgi:hypothetical protein
MLSSGVDPEQQGADPDPELENSDLEPGQVF